MKQQKQKEQRNRVLASSQRAYLQLQKEIETKPKHARFARIVTATIATAAAVVCLALSVPNLNSMTGDQGGSNPPWFPSLMAFEHYDSGRTKLFEQAHFTGSFAGDNSVHARSALDEYPTPYNVVYLSANSLFVFGGAYGDKGGTGSFVARVNPKAFCI